jgi:uncharacterized membrane protein YeaQ/YmgE (transglycosylase-associated protein family)
MTVLAWLLIGMMLGLLARAAMPVPRDSGKLPPIIVAMCSAIVGGGLSAIFLGGELMGFNRHSVTWATIVSMYVLFGFRCLAMRASARRSARDVNHLSERVS